MVRHSPSPLLTSTPRPSTPPTPHRGQPHHQENNTSSPTMSVFANGGVVNHTGGIFSNSLPMQMHTQQQQQQLPGSGHSVNGIAWGASPASASSHFSPSSSTSHHQQVQWGSGPSLLPASIQWGSTSSFSTPGPSGFHNTGSPLASSSSTIHNNDHFTSTSSPSYAVPDRSRKSEIKRKRMQEEDEDEDMGCPVAVAIRSSPDRGGVEGGGRILAGQSRNLVPKRLRTGLGGILGLDEGIGMVASEGLLTSTSSKNRGDHSGTAAARKGVDLGKMLASLDKSNLLSLLTSLIAQHPQIADSIHSLLPLPTLESVNYSLDAYEAAIKSALPFGAESIRSEYTWNRLRGPVGELVSGVQRWMDFFHAKEEKEVEGSGAVHPSTMFSLLHTITVRSIKIQRDLPAVPSQWVSGASSLRSMNSGDDGHPLSVAPSTASTNQRVLLSALPSGLLSPSNPNAMVTTLLPLLLGAWDGLLARITHDLNGQGKMFGREVVVSWLRGVEGVASGDITSMEGGEGEGQVVEVLRAVQKALKGVEADFKREVGWVVGVF